MCDVAKRIDLKSLAGFSAFQQMKFMILLIGKQAEQNAAGKNPNSNRYINLEFAYLNAFFKLFNVLPPVYI